MKKLIVPCASLALFLCLLSCSNALLDKVQAEIAAFKEAQNTQNQGQQQAQLSKPTVSLSFTALAGSSTNNPQVAITVSGAATAYSSSAQASIVGYLVKESRSGVPSAPLADDVGWLETPPTSFSFTMTSAGSLNGVHGLYAWTKDSFGNVSEAATRQLTLAPLAASWLSPYVNGAVITSHESLVLDSAEALVISGASATGSLLSAPSAWSLSAGSDSSIVVLSPGSSGTGLWQAGSNRSLTLTVKTALGLDLTRTISLSPFNGVCVSDPISNPSNPGQLGAAGTLANPLSRVQDGIDKAASLYGTGPAEVRVAAGTYKAVCSNNADPALNVYVANLSPGISLYGGWNQTFVARNGGDSILLDESTTVSVSGESNPVRTVNATGSAITRETIVDGFTIKLGTGGSGSYSHVGIHCEEQASPIIKNCTIAGTGTCGTAIGINLINSDAKIELCSINPGSSTSRSRGFRIFGGGAPEIIDSSISGGTSNTNTFGFAIYTGTNPIIKSCIIEGGLFNTNGYCIWVSQGSPSIIDCIFNSSTNKPSTFAFYEVDGISDPITFINNHFNYSDNGTNWYWDEGSIGIGLTNAETTTINNGAGDILLFNDEDGNTHGHL